MAWGDEYTTVGNYGQYGSSGSGSTSGGANSKFNWGGLVNGATSLYELYNAYQASKKPKLDFVQPPLSPEQRKMWDLAYRAVSQLPTAQMLGPMAQSILGGYSGMGWKGANSVAIPYYGIGASGPSYSSPNTTYQLGPAYWQNPNAGQANRPSPENQHGNNGGATPSPARQGGAYAPFQRVASPYAEEGGQESIGGALFRDPSLDVGGHLPNGGQSQEPRPGMSYGEMPQSVRDGLGSLWRTVTASGGGWDTIMALDPTGISRLINIPIEIAKGVYGLVHRGRNGGQQASGGGATGGSGIGGTR